MAVVRIDDDLLKKVKEIIKLEDNKYKYSSVSSFLNSLIHEKIKNLGSKK